MRKKHIIKVTIIILAITSFFTVLALLNLQKNNKVNISRMKLTSPTFSHGETIPKKYTCNGEDVNPTLNISETPQEAMSLVLIIDDPDAPNGTWSHWTVWDIPTSTKVIEENSVPTGAIVGENDFKQSLYRGPCPPRGTHRYFFKLYALDTIINLPQSSTLSELQNAMKNHIIEEAELEGIYEQ